MCDSMQNVMKVKDWKNVLKSKLGKKVSEEFIMSFCTREPTNFQVLDIVPGVYFPKLDSRMDEVFLENIHEAFYKEKVKPEYQSDRAATKLRNVYISKALSHFLNFDDSKMLKKDRLTKKEKTFLEKRIKLYLCM